MVGIETGLSPDLSFTLLCSVKITQIKDIMHQVINSRGKKVCFLRGFMIVKSFKRNYKQIIQKRGKWDEQRKNYQKVSKPQAL